MLDISTIGIAIETSGVEKGIASLQNAEAAAGRTADAADNVGRASKTGFDRAATAAENAMSSFNRMAQAMTVGSLAASLIEKALSQVGKVIDYLENSAKLAARFETLGVVMQTIGRNAGYTGQQMMDAAKGVQSMGITMLESRESVTKMASAQIDLSNATKLSRVAQDAAVIGGINSSEALKSMVYGIQSAQTEVLRTIGINVSFENSYRKLATQLGTTAESLSEQEKVTARTNAVMEAGTKIAGAYEDAMGTAGKQMTSLARYSEDAQVKLGAVFNESMLLAIATYTGHLKESNSTLDELTRNNSIEQWSQSMANAFAFVADAAKNSFSVLSSAADTFYTGLAQMNAMGRLNGGEMVDLGKGWLDRMKERFNPSGQMRTQLQNLRDQKEADAKTLNMPDKSVIVFETPEQKQAYKDGLAGIKKAMGDRQAAVDTASDAMITALKKNRTEAQKIEDDINRFRKIQSAAGVDLNSEEVKRAEAAIISRGKTIKPKAIRSTRAADRSAERAEQLEQKMAYDNLITDQKAYSDEAKFINEQLIKDLDSANKRGISSEYDYINQKNDAALLGITDQQAIVENEMAIANASKLPLLEKQKAIEAFQKAMQDLNQTQVALNADVIRQENELNDKVRNAMDARVEIVKKATQGLLDEQKSLRQEREEFGLTEKQLQALQIARADELAVMLEKKAVTLDSIDLSGAESEELRKQAELIRSNARLRVDNTGVKEMQAQWKTFYGDIERGLTDSLFRAFESGKGFFKTLWDGIKNLFKTTVLKLVIQGTVGSLLGSVGNAANALGLGGTGGGLGSILGMGSNASSLMSVGRMIGNGFAGTIGSGVGAVFGTTAGNVALGSTLGLGTGSSLAAASAASVAGGGAAAGSALTGAAGALGGIGPVGWAAMAALAAFSIFKKESKPSSSTGDAAMQFDSLGNRTGQVDNSRASYKAMDSLAYNNIVIGLQADYAAKAKALGMTPSASGFGFAGNTGEGGEKPKIAVIGRAGGSIYESGEIEKTDANMKLLAARAVFAALQGSELPKHLKGVFDGLAAGNMQTDDISKAITHAQDLQNLNAQLLKMPFKELAELSFTATQGMIAAAGGMDKLSAGLTSYYDNYYTESEKTAITSRQIADALGAVNQVMPTTRMEFRSLVDKAIALGDAGAPTVSALLSVESAFARITPVAIDAANATAQASDAMAQAAAKMQTQISGLAADYLNNSQLRQFRAGEIQQTLSGGGVNVSIEQILTASRNDALALFNSYVANSPQQQAILDAAKAFADMTPAVVAQTYSESGGGGSYGGGALSNAISEQTRATDNLIAAMKDLNSSLLENSGPDSFARLQAQFAFDIASAKAGSLSAAQELPNIAKALDAAGKQYSASAVDQAVLTGQIIESLGSVVASPASGRATEGVNRDAQLELIRLQYQAMQETMTVIARNTARTAASLDDAAGGARPLATVALT